jgi:hypothetical protein
MTAIIQERMTGAAETPAELGAKYIRWGFRLFIFGLVVGFIPLAHYMHGSFEPVEAAFLQKVTLWWGCAFTLAVYVAQIGGLAMVVIGLCYVVFARDGAMTSVTAAERIAPVLCATGIIVEFVAGVAGYYAVVAVWPNFYYGAITAGRVTWLALQGVCIVVYVIGVMWAYSGIKHAVRSNHALASR